MYEVPPVKKEHVPQHIRLGIAIATLLIPVTCCLLGFSIMYLIPGGLCLYSQNGDLCKALVRQQGLRIALVSSIVLILSIMFHWIYRRGGATIILMGIEAILLLALLGLVIVILS